MLSSTEATDVHPTSLCHNNLSVSVSIDDKPVEMYKVQVDGNKATCYIEAVEGKEFKIHRRILKTFLPHNMAFFHSVDGSYMGGLWIRDIADRGIFCGPQTSATTRQSLVFSKINLTDDADVASNDEQFVKNLGTIRVTGLRGTEIGPSPKPVGRAEFDLFANDRAVDERSKKANVSHQVGLGASVAIVAQPSVKVAYIDSTEHPFTVFEIKYRSRALLELDDIVKPRVPTTNDASPPSSSPPAKPIMTKKRKSTSNYTFDKNGAIVLSDDSDDEDGNDNQDKGGGAVKQEGHKKIKKEKGKEKKEKEWIEID